MAGKTSVERPTSSRAECPFCRVMRKVTPAGRFELHSFTDRWKRRRCRGSGELAHAQKK